MLTLIIVSLVWYGFSELKQRMLNIFTHMEHFYMSFGTGVKNFYKQPVFGPPYITIIFTIQTLAMLHFY